MRLCDPLIRVAVLTEVAEVVESRRLSEVHGTLLYQHNPVNWHSAAVLSLSCITFYHGLRRDCARSIGQLRSIQ